MIVMFGNYVLLQLLSGLPDLVKESAKSATQTASVTQSNARVSSHARPQSSQDNHP